MIGKGLVASALKGSDQANSRIAAEAAARYRRHVSVQLPVAVTSARRPALYSAVSKPCSLLGTAPPDGNGPSLLVTALQYRAAKCR